MKNIPLFDDLFDCVSAKLSNELDQNLTYHNLAHTLDVVKCVEIIGKWEGVSQEEIVLLKSAALLHDIGFIESVEGHEQKGCEFAKAELPGYQFSGEQIKIICDLIHSTAIGVEPRSLLERIMCDADLDYLGREDYFTIAERLLKELIYKDQIANIEDWNAIQVTFLENHTYWTGYSKANRKEMKLQNLKRLKDK